MTTWVIDLVLPDSLDDPVAVPVEGGVTKNVVGVQPIIIPEVAKNVKRNRGASKHKWFFSFFFLDLRRVQNPYVHDV